MSEENSSSEKTAQDFIAEADTGARQPSGPVAKLLIGVTLFWSFFQLWYASPLPFLFGWGVFNSSEARSIHLALAVFLAFTAFPAFKRSPRHHIPIQDWFFALLGAFCAAYLYLFYNQLADRPGAPITQDIVVGVIGIALLLEATRRALGPPLMVVASIFMIYTFAGPWMPDVVAHKGASLNKGISHYWLATEGVYGVALGVSTSMVFLFVLFGSLLEHAGAGNYFIRVAFALMGHFKGGPAKAAVVSSAMTGMISGSSIANVVTTGTFTIPLMKKVGFSAEKAGAVEVASSTNGQLTPPIMGAAAFLMVEYIGIPYTQVIKHAFLPALISYIALVYIVHLEACKAGMKGLPRIHKMLARGRMIGAVSLLTVAGFLIYVLPPTMGWLKQAAGEGTPWIVAVLLAVGYTALLKLASQYEDLDTNPEILELPPVGPTVMAGLHFLLPVVLLVWCLTVERLSPGLSAFWATVFMVFVVVTQHPMKSYFRKDGKDTKSWSEGLDEFYQGMLSGAKNMIGIGVATAAAGLIVGTVTITGIGLVMTEFVELISGGSIFLTLLFTAMISLLLGMGLPTTANYIVVSSLMAPVLMELAAKGGLILPLIAVHLFVFFFGILADDTPPVGLAAFAAAAISKGDPIKTGLQGFAYDIRTAILPFLFVYNTELLMIGITGPIHVVVVIAVAVTAMLVFAAATQGFFLEKSKYWETATLLLIAFTLFRPGFWMDQVIPPVIEKSPTEIVMLAGEQPENGDLRVKVTGESIDGKQVTKTVVLPMGKQGNGADRLAAAGIVTRTENDKVFVDDVVFGSKAAGMGIDFDWQILNIQVKADRPPKQLLYLPALLLLGLVIFTQRSRRRTMQTATA
ncbi:MAG: TRAP transporter permease [Proteobacteria bacterium]|nr:TRAP transporter permease [Pseudomonadota bacterium]